MRLFTAAFFCLLSIFTTTQAQSVSINNDGSVPNQSAALDIKSNNKGLLIPRLTALQRTNITAPATGLLVYQTDIPAGFYYNQGTGAIPDWIQLGATGPQGPAGLPGIVKGYYKAGTMAYPSSTLAFITAPLTITITEGQKVFMTASRAMGGYAAANELGIYPAYQSVVPGSPVVNLGLGMFGLQVPSNTRVTFSVNGVFENLSAGTYHFGMSGVTSSPNWTNCEWGYTSLLVY